jgi:hypothetical protein
MKSVILEVLMARSLFLSAALVLCLGVLVAADEIHEYDFELLKTIPVGSAEGQIGHDSGDAGGPDEPRTMAISPAGNIYIPDIINERVNLYDSEMNFLSSIDTQKSKAHLSSKMAVDDRGRIAFRWYGDGVTILSATGEVLVHVLERELPIRSASITNLYPIGDYVFFYGKDGYVAGITSEGRVMGNAESLKSLGTVQEKRSTSRAASRAEATVNEQLSNRKRILLGDQYFPQNWYDQNDYGKELSRKVPAIDAQKRQMKASSMNIITDGFDLEGPYGLDSDGNSYFTFRDNRGKKGGIIVRSKYGDILDAFYAADWENPDAYVGRGFYAVAPNGDIYFLTYKDPDYVFYRLKRRW